MIIYFYKYQGAGNDFIIIDERERSIIPENKNNQKLIEFLCDRRFGIGADGLMQLRNHREHDFRMVYYNADGNEGTMCGNGGRCLVAFAAHQNVIRTSTLFTAIDGLHKAEIKKAEGKNLIVSLQMKDVTEIKQMQGGYFLDTGSPHFVVFTDNLLKIDVIEQGKKLRYDPAFGQGGTNVNFAQIVDHEIHVRTYERGVENETLACGTGITATAIAAAFGQGMENIPQFALKARGGDLKVSFQINGPTLFDNVFLEGPATMVFKGEIEISDSWLQNDQLK